VPPPQTTTGQEEEQSLRDAALNGQFESIENLLSGDITLNAADPDGRTALMLASFNGYELSRCLLIMVPR
jgi:ankyrin repeat protein